MKEQLNRFIFRQFSGNDALKSIFGRRAVEWFKDIIGADELVQVGSVDNLFSVERAYDFSVEEPTHLTLDVFRRHDLHESAEKTLSDGTYAIPSPHALHLEQCMVSLSEHVILNRERTVAKESINIGDNAYAVNRKALCTENIERIEGPATLLRAPGTGYFHAQVDSLPRLTLLRQSPFASFEEIKLLRPKHGPAVNYELEDYYVPRIAPPNCRIVELDEDALYEISNYIFLPFLTRMGAPYIPSPYRELLRKSLLPDRPSRHDERIYISRAKASRRRVTNETELIDALHAYNFKRYYLEDLHIKDKIELFYDAECVVSPHGAGLTSLLFCDEASVLELFPSKLLETSFFFISQSVGLNHVVWKPSHKRHRNDDFDVNVDEVVAILEEDLGITKTPSYR